MDTPTARRPESATNDAAGSVHRVSQPLSEYGFSFTDFLARDFRFGLDPGRPLCKAFQEGHCPDREKGRCYDIHPMSRTFNNLVCKHWLRGLCKKGDQCEFLHEYNLRRMPECNHYTRSLTCPNGDECLFSHIDPVTKLTPCPHYEKGFCPLGPRCNKKHVRKFICKFYLAGFCPSGRQCKEGAHPRFPINLPKPTIKVERTAGEIETERRQREEAMREEKQREWDRRDGNLGDAREGNQRDGRDNNRREGRGRGKGRYGGRRRGDFER